MRRQSRAGQRAGGWCRCPARAFALHLPCLTTGKDPTLSMCARLQGMDDTPRRAVPPLMNKVQAPLSATAVLTATSCASCCSLQTDTATPSSETIKQGTGGQQHGIELQSGQVTSAVRAAQTPGPLPPPWQASVPAPGRRRLPAAAVAAVSRAGTLPADRLALALAPRSVKGRVSGFQCLARSVTLCVHSSPGSCLSHQALLPPKLTYAPQSSHWCCDSSSMAGWGRAGAHGTAGNVQRSCGVPCCKRQK